MLIWSSLPADFTMRVQHSYMALTINSVKTKCRGPLTMTFIVDFVTARREGNPTQQPTYGSPRCTCDVCALAGPEQQEEQQRWWQETARCCGKIRYETAAVHLLNTLSFKENARDSRLQHLIGHWERRHTYIFKE